MFSEFLFGGRDLRAYFFVEGYLVFLSIHSALLGLVGWVATPWVNVHTIPMIVGTSSREVALRGSAMATDFVVYRDMTIFDLRRFLQPLRRYSPPRFGGHSRTPHILRYRMFQKTLDRL